MDVAIDCPRDADEVRCLRAHAEDSHAAGRVREQTYIGRQLGLRLVGAGVLMLQLQGEHWMRAATAFAELEGMLRAFVEHYRVVPWQGFYALDQEFERYRQAEVARRGAEDAYCREAADRDNATRSGINRG